MFVYYFVHIEAPFLRAETAVLGQVGALPVLADESYREGAALWPRDSEATRVGPVRLIAAVPTRGPSETVIPLLWQATGPPILFPAMEADLVVASVGPSLSQLTFRGFYTPPLGRLGRTLDRAVMHRIAESVVKHFVDRIAISVAGELAPAR